MDRICGSCVCKRKRSTMGIVTMDDLFETDQESSLQSNDKVVAHLGESFANNQLYSCYGTRFLVAINGLDFRAAYHFEDSDNASTALTAAKYVKNYKSTSNTVVNGPIDELPPHVFGVATDAYLLMRQTGLSQSISFTVIPDRVIPRTVD